MKSREIVLVGVVLLVIVLIGILVGLVGIGICDARERSEANHFCLVGEPGLEAALVAVEVVLVVVPRSVRPFVKPLAVRTAPADRPLDGRLIEPCDVDFLIPDPGDTFSPPGQAEQLTSATGEVDIEDISAVDLRIELTAQSGNMPCLIYGICGLWIDDDRIMLQYKRNNDNETKQLSSDWKAKGKHEASALGVK